MSRKLFGLVLCSLFLASNFPVQAQQPEKVPRIGYLTVSSLSRIPQRIESFQRGLRDLGYFEGKNIVIEWRGADGNRDRIAALAAELVRLNVDVIVTGGGGATRPAKEATSAIPIVMAQDEDPVGNGFVISLARPGGNITGLSTLSPEISGKRLELLKEVIPKLAHVAVLGTSTNTGNKISLKETELAAEAMGVKLQFLEVQSSKDIEAGFQAASKARTDAVLLLPNPFHFSMRNQIAEFAIRNRLPVVYGRPEYVEAGGLMNYGVSFTHLDRRAATFVDKILKGAKPADLPVEQPTKFEFVINLKAAKQIGLTIPPNVLARADRVIK